ncbi:DUF4124 domain-containing protein [Hahella sp. CCB-MM4]|uniref:DUF4124 domain-containing protein n=1 Tax=Hahella sp. (strain CCB-MM4) TaxID=1926491 RepID=UPI001FEFCB1C|nr:DUF4124 domain-containing protein [Hahella sp. CCB-MM4]
MASLIASQPLSAEIYRWVDDQGNVEYSDQPRDGATKIEVQDPATISLPKLSNLPATTSGEDTPPPLQYKRLQITFPENGSAFHSGDGNITVLTEVSPDLLPNHSLRLTMDGSVMGTTKAGFFTLTNIDRGTHVLQLDIIDNSSVVQSGPSVTFTIHRPSVLKKN